jgi:ADP-dependent NAD(P)H-hydrate dehydratase / NAD(P)H-hydrate epimerase
MNEILTAAQQRQADAHTIAHEPIASIDLMERASRAFVNAIVPFIHGKPTIHVFCGTGNNGGDGLAVARILREKGCVVHAYLVGNPDATSADCRINLTRLDEYTVLDQGSSLPFIHPDHVVIDALFGSGLTRAVTGLSASVIHHINASGAKVLAIDVPSGLPCDSLPFDDGAVVRAHFTGTFERPKQSFFFRESARWLLNWEVIPIGLNPNFIASLGCNTFYLTEELFQCKLLPRTRFSHKGTYGHGLLIAGSYGKMGAAVLSARAALRSGLGLLTVHLPECGYTILQSAVPEAMCSVDESIQLVRNLPDLSPYRAIAAGPGLGTGEHAHNVLEQLVSEYQKPVVLDADALNTLSAHPELWEALPKNSILTPHPGEFERLAAAWRKESSGAMNSIERHTLQRTMAEQHGVLIVLKDAVTSIALPDGRVYYNTTGNPGMATGGSGDVLTGIILGLLTQGYSPEEAALIGVFYHGKAGDDAAHHVGENQLIASDIIHYLRINPVK